MQPNNNKQIPARVEGIFSDASESRNGRAPLRCGEDWSQIAADAKAGRLAVVVVTTPATIGTAA